MLELGQATNLEP